MYRYFLYIDGVEIPVKPLETAKLKKVTAREREQIFYRTKLSGSLVFEGADYQQLLLVENSELRCSEIKFRIEKKCGGVWSEDWKGYFSCNDVKWDLSKCRATVNPFPDDEYRHILQNYSKEYNILPVTEPVIARVKLDLQADFEFKFITHGEIPDGSTWALFLEGTYFIKGTLTRKGTHFNQDIYYRLVRRENKVAGEAQELNGWQVVEETSSTVTYAKAPDLYNFTPYKWDTVYKAVFGDWDTFQPFAYYPDLIQVDCGTPYDETRYIDVTAGKSDDEMCSVGCWNVRTKINESRCVKVLWEFGKFSFTRNRKFMDVVRYLATATAGPELVTGTDAEISRFFNEPLNYVTEMPNTLTGLQVATLSDVIGYSSSEPARKGEWSLKKLLDNLRQMFRVFWDIHEGKLRIEHESFYQLQGEKDLTVYPQHIAKTDAYEYVKSKMPRYQRLVFSSANNEDFERGVIEYGGVCVSMEEGEDTEEWTVTDITTDLEYLIVSGGTTAQKGFVLMLVQDGQIVKEKGALTGLLMPNAGLAAANLVSDYYTHNRVLENGIVNRNIRIFKSVQKTKKQVSLNVPICCELVNPYARFISTLGANAELETMSETLVTGGVEITLLHDTTGKLPLRLGRQFDDSFSHSFR